ncbi:MAG: sugar transferase [Planctomycetota bacterium]|nr:sugar transferase [Planctomycetota bacterium]
MDFLRRNFESLFLVLQVWLDGLTVIGGCLVGLWVFPFFFNVPAASIAEYAQLFVLITGTTLLTYWFLGLYRSQKSVLNVEEYRQLSKATGLSFLLTCTLVFMLREAAGKLQEVDHWFYRLLRPAYELFKLEGTEDYSRVMLMVVFLSILLLGIVQRAVSFRLLSRLHAHGIGNVNVAVFGTGPMARRIQQKLKLFPTLGYNFVGFLERDSERRSARIGGYEVLGSDRDLDSVRDAHQIRLVIVAKPELEEEELIALCRRFEDFDIRYQVVPRLYHFFSRRFTLETLDSVPLITPHTVPLRPVYFFLKRAMDVAVAGLVLLAASPGLLVIALMIKHQSPGPVLFAQYRRGTRNTTFRIFKFRTMFTEMCGDAITPQDAQDPRVTPFGRFLRKTSLDELPQLWNVLRGDMSLVGPRPEMPFIVEDYDEMQRMRLDVKPGITGLWQVSEARKAPIHENVDYDLYYIENQSVFLDITIFIMTVGTVLRLRSTH